MSNKVDCQKTDGSFCHSHKLTCTELRQELEGFKVSLVFDSNENVQVSLPIEFFMR